MNNKLEEFRISLPDYIQGKIKDVNEIERIENEIRINPEFKKEYENLKESMYFLETSKLQEPSEHYFNSILPRLNTKIEEKKRTKQNIFSFLKIKKYYWGYLVPVVPVLLIFLIYSVYFNNHSNVENAVYISNDNKTELNHIDSEINKKEYDNKIPEQSEDIEDSLIDSESASIGNNTIINNYSYNNKKKDIVENTEDIDAYDSETADVFSKEEDDLNNLQSQFNQLDDNTQNDILDNLKNEKL